MNLEQLLLDFLIASSQRALLPHRSLHTVCDFQTWYWSHVRSPFSGDVRGP